MARSRAMPAPLMPPPRMRTSKVSLRRRSMFCGRVSGVKAGAKGIRERHNVADRRYTGSVNRRHFLALGTAAALPAQTPSPRFIKSICSIMFPSQMPVTEKFRQAKNAGFEAIELRYGEEISPSLSADEVKRIGDAAHETGLQIASMWMGGPFRSNPINSPDPAVRAKSLEGLKQGLEFANHLNCGATLLYLCRLGDGPKLQFGYEDTWNRVTEELPKAIPWAEEAKVCLTP